MIGIDISQQAIKVVVLERAGADEYRVVRAGISEWRNEESDTPEDIVKKQKHALLVLKDSCQIKDNSSVIVSLPSNAVFIRYLDILKSNKKKADDFVKYEAQQQIPFPLDEVAWDHIQISPKGGNKQAVLMAVKNDLLEGSMSVVREAKLRTSFVNLGLINLVNCALMSRALKRNEVGVLVDIGTQDTGVVIYKKGELWLRSFSCGSEMMVQQIADELSVSREKAQSLLSASPDEAGDNAEAVRNAVSGTLQRIADEVVRSLSFFKSEYERKHEGKGEHISDESVRLLLAGSLVRMGGVADFFSRHTGLTAKELSWSGKVTCSGSVARGITISGDGSGEAFSEDDVPYVFGVATGAALAEKGRPDFIINFLKHKLASTTNRAVGRMLIAVSVVLCVLAGAALVTATVLTMRVNEARAAKLTRVLNTFDMFRDDVVSVIQEKARLSDEANFFVSYISKRYVWVELMSQVAEIAPLNIWFDEFDGALDLSGANKDTVELKGYMVSYDDFNGFLAELKKLPVVRAVKPEEIESEDGKFRFVLKIDLNTLGLEKV